MAHPRDAIGLRPDPIGNLRLIYLHHHAVRACYIRRPTPRQIFRLSRDDAATRANGFHIRVDSVTRQLEQRPAMAADVSPGAAMQRNDVRADSYLGEALAGVTVDWAAEYLLEEFSDLPVLLWTLADYPYVIELDRHVSSMTLILIFIGCLGC